jgi:hypothetical protein
MNPISKLALTVATTAALGAATTPAFAGSNLQGPELTGIALPAIEASQPAVTTVTLPTGEAVDLHPQSDH